ncbi:MAG TPA: hypothetical protein VNM37_07775, partial [Candidatus Dormibacteraeota bacterium]|nr:hypothetical protein [Candidatus Dormibacteraeota bacterium]
MPFNGSGVYSFPSLPGSFNPAISGQQATPTDWNTLAADLTANGLSNTICKDGQTVVTANIPFAGFKLTGVGSGTAQTDAVNVSQLQGGAGVYAADTGAVNVITLAPSPVITAYAVGQLFRFKANHTNTTTTPTAAVSGLTAGTIVMPDGSALVAGAIVIGGQYQIAVSNVTTGTPTFQLETVSIPTLAQANNTVAPANTAYVDRVAVQQVVVTQTGAVATGTTLIPLDDTIPQKTEGDEYMTLAITPKSATSKLVIEITLCASQNIAGSNNVIVALFQDAGNDALAAATQLSSEQF